MAPLDAFERIVRLSPGPAKSEAEAAGSLHPFDVRNIYQGFPPKVRKLFDDGHCAEATFEVLKFLDKKVSALSGKNESGKALMNQVFSSTAPVLKLTPMSTESQREEQDGYRFLFAGIMTAIRNPRGHEFNMSDDPDVCLDHLSFASMLIRRLEESGYK